MTGSRPQAINGVLLLLTFLCVRIFYGGFLVCSLEYITKLLPYFAPPSLELGVLQYNAGHKTADFIHRILLLLAWQWSSQLFELALVCLLFLVYSLIHVPHSSWF